VASELPVGFPGRTIRCHFNTVVGTEMQAWPRVVFHDARDYCTWPGHGEPFPVVVGGGLPIASRPRL
jgi:hypothetical protein